MKVKRGYKQTAVGIIPTEWACVRMSDIAILESGHTPSKRQASYWSGPIPWVSLHDTDALDRKEIFATAQTITEDGLNNSSARLLPKGTVVFSRTATVGKTTVLGREMATSQDFANYICGPQLNNHFLVYLFRSMGRRWKSLMAGSIHNTVYMPVFKALQIALPPLGEQRAIVEALSDMDSLLDGLDQLIAKKRDLKQAAMQQLLTGQTRLPGFRDAWETCPVRQKGEVVTGKALAASAIGTLRPYLRTKNVYDGRIDITDVLTMPMDEVQFERFRVRRDDVLLNEGQSLDLVGRCAIYQDEYPEPCAIQNQLLRFRAQRGVSPLFASYLFRHCQLTGVFAKIALQTTSIAHLGGSRLEALRLAWPKTEIEQTAIAEVLADMDAELATLEQRREKTRALKQGMMQELLTGKTRLVTP